MSAARGSLGRLLAVVVFTGAAGAARAGEPADRGISLSAWAGAALDRSVSYADSGRPVNGMAPVVGATGVGNIERLAIGGSIDATPAVEGNGRLTLSLLLGFQPQIGRTRLQLLGEGGRRRFSEVGGNMLGHQLGADTWLPFAGIRLGAARTLPARGPFELGLWLYGRYDVGRKTVTNMSGWAGEETRTDYRVGGYTAGLALRVGLRLEAPHPWNQGVMVE